MGPENNIRSRVEFRRSVRLRRSKFQHGYPELSFKIAHETSEYEQAFELVWRQYRNVGLEGEKASDLHKIRLTKYHLLPGSKVFVVIARDGSHKNGDKNRRARRIIGTATMVMDSRLGLPVEEVCGDEVRRLRESGRVLAEVIALAIAPKYGRKDLWSGAVMHLFKMVFAYARYKGVDDLLCSVTKRHVEFYRTLLLFEPIGEMRPYSYANQIEVQGHRLNMHGIEQVAKETYSTDQFDADLHSFFFGESIELHKESGEGHPLSPDQLRYFLAERTNMIHALDDRTLNILRDEYKAAGYPFPNESDVASWRSQEE